MNMTLNGATLDCKEWDNKLDQVLDNSWFDNIAEHLEQAGYKPENIIERRKRCMCRLIVLPNAGVAELHIERYKERYNERCPVSAGSIESYRQTFPDDNMEWWDKIQAAKLRQTQKELQRNRFAK